MHDELGWAADTPDLFCATFSSAWGSKRHLVVESIPGGGWDWSAWANDGSGQCLHGRADSPGGAMVAAEGAARLLANAPVSDFAVMRTWTLNPEEIRPN